MSEANLIPAERIERRILLLHGQKVMLDFQLAELYEVEARSLNQAVKRNLERFPEDFMFQLSESETEQIMRPTISAASPPNSSQVVMSSGSNSPATTTPIGNSSQIVTSSRKHRGLVYRPYAFTEQGVAMLSSVLRSPRAIQVNIAIMRTFVQLRRILATHADLSRTLAALESKYDAQFKEVFDAIRELMKPLPEDKPRREIGFHTQMPGREPKSRARAKTRISA
jgi:hypothetical protein